MRNPTDGAGSALAWRRAAGGEPMRILSALRVAGLLGAALVWGCSNGSTGRDDHAATHPDPDPPTSNDPPPPPSVPPPPVVKPPPPPPPPWNAGTPEPGMVIHSEVGSVRGVSVDEGANAWVVEGGRIGRLRHGSAG